MEHYLRIPTNNEDVHLRNAIEIANCFLHSHKSAAVFRTFFQVEYENENWKICQHKLKDIRVVFGQGCLDSGWAFRNEDENLGHDLRTIFISHWFRSRLHKINNDQDQEAKAIVVYLGIVILHELAHLILRWTVGPLTPPKKFTYAGKKEAGLFLEQQLFGSVVHIFIARGTQWSEASEYKGIHKTSSA